MGQDLKLKRGYGRSFEGENWKLAKDDKWSHHRLYIPYGEEPFHGTRMIDGVEHAVFRCRNDDFFAQPVEICALPVPEDPMEVLYEMPEGVQEGVDEEAATPAESTCLGLEQMDD